MEETRNMVQAIAMIDIDPSFTPFSQEQYKWLTSIQIVQQIPRDKQNSKNFAIVPGVYMVLTFCEKNKDPIYQVQFNFKPESDWNIVKMPEAIQPTIGPYLCYKTTPDLMSGPICDIQIQSIQRKNRNGENKQIFTVPKGYRPISHQLPFGFLIYSKVKSKFEKTFKSILTQKYTSSKASRINLSQLHLFCFPQGIKIVKQIMGFFTFNFVFTLQTAERIYVTCLILKQTLDEQQKQKLEIIQNCQFFYEKALCILSNQCYTDQFAECLIHLYRLSMCKGDVPFWKIAQTFVNQMIMPPVPSLGELGICYNYNGFKINFPTNRKYPFVSQRALYSIFKFMTIQNIISVFQSILLQRKVIFVSQSKTILGYATQAFLALIYPFRWEQVLIPILPTNLKQYLTAPVPLIAGISPQLVDQNIQNDSLIVHLDKNQILNDEQNPPLPEKLLKQLNKRLQKFQIYEPNEVKQYLQNPQSIYLFKLQEVNDPQFQGHLIRDSFFQFLLTLMKNYKKFMGKPKITKEQQQSSMINFNEPALMNNIFKVQDFLCDLGMTKVGSFGYKFTQSSIFTSFIQRRYQMPSHPQIVFFDQCIQRKKSKKEASFIVPSINKQYQIIKNPVVSVDDPGPFFYQRFPSLHKQRIKTQEVQIKIVDQQQQQNKLMSIIQDQFYLNNGFFDIHQVQDQLERKMFNLLLNKNKFKFEVSKNKKKMVILKQFIQIYEKQCSEIDALINQWPAVVSEEQFVSMKKTQYLKCRKLDKYKQNTIIGVFEGEDYQMLLKNQTRVVFVGLGCCSTSYKSSSIILQVLSYRIKNFINKLISKQAGLIMQFCKRQAMKDIRASSLKRASEQSWNIETILLLRSFLQQEKQFGTGISGVKSDCQQN